jgi:hypothetical protein
MYDPNLSLADSIDMMCDLVDQFRDSYGGDYFTWNSQQWNCDTVSRQNITGGVALSILGGGNLPSGFTWRDYNNNDTPTTGTQMGELGAQLMKFVTACYIAGWAHKANIRALTDVTSVQSYDYMSTLWPDVNTQI